eukprot:14837-Heterococcus_DN1.PRE.2
MVAAAAAAVAAAAGTASLTSSWALGANQTCKSDSPKFMPQNFTNHSSSDPVSAAKAVAAQRVASTAAAAVSKLSVRLVVRPPAGAAWHHAHMQCTDTAASR